MLVKVFLFKLGNYQPNSVGQSDKVFLLEWQFMTEEGYGFKEIKDMSVNQQWHFHCLQVAITTPDVESWSYPYIKSPYR